MSGWSEDLIGPENVDTLDGLFRERVRRSADRTAYISYDRESKAWEPTTWAQAAAKVGQWQKALDAELLQPGDRVALILRNCKEWVYFDQAALGLGLVVVPLYTDDRPDNIEYILEDAAVKLLLVQDWGRWRRLAPTIKPGGHLQRVVVLGGSVGDSQFVGDERLRAVEDWLPRQPTSPRRRGGHGQQLASIVYTSGTTGRPKGVMLSHYNLLSVAHAALTMVDCYQEDEFLSFLPLSHTLERTAGYYLPMMAGASVAYARSIPQLAEDLQALKPTVLIAVPRIFERVYARLNDQLKERSAVARWLFRAAERAGWSRFECQQGRRRWHPRLLLWPLLRRVVAVPVMERLGGRLRITVSGGAPLSAKVARTFIGLGIPLLQGYGLTETSPVISVNTLRTNDPASVGVPLRGVEVCIGEHEELLVKSPGIMLGYWNNHAATLDMIDSNGWLHTGDQACLKDGYIYITGRLKDILVLSNGEKVPPGDMELALCLDPLFEQAVVVGEGRPYLTALIVVSGDLWPGFAQDQGLDPLAPESLQDVRVQSAVGLRIDAALKDFPGYAKIRKASLFLEPWTVDNGLLTPTLKVKRKKVLERYRDRIDAMYREGPARG